VELLYDLAASFLRFKNTGPAFPVSLLYLMVAGLPVTVLHELGHAAAARRLLDADVQVSVGSVGRLTEVRLGQISVSIRALSLPGRVAGAAEVDATRAGARDVLLIALAGPAASLVGAAVTAGLLQSAPPTGVAHNLLWAATLAGAFGVLNLVPLTVQERRGGPSLRTDGRLALDALRVLLVLR